MYTVCNCTPTDGEGFDAVSPSACPTSDLRQSPVPSAAESGAVGAQSGAVDPDLDLIVTCWPMLPENVRQGIVATVRQAVGAAAKGGETRAEEPSQR